MATFTKLSLSMFQFLLIVSFVINVVQCGPKCNINKADKCAADVFVFGHSNITLPENSEQVEQHCKARFQALRCVQNYIRDCLTLFPKQVVSLLIKGAANNAKQQCKIDRQEFIERSKCYRKNREGLGQCMKKLIVELAEAEKQKDKVPLTCCILRQYRDCSIKILDADQEQCKPDDSRYFLKMVEGNAADVFELVCRNNRKIEKPVNSKGEKVCLEINERQAKSSSRRTLSLLPSYIKIFTE
ncbi:uncharacterized protein LOC107360040 [Tetranychus urticae]|uniref:DUF19 domain-containing protein n=2 Tax=Tetranychus urticae TaxID=32264 RepID=T1JQK9_TETUR|nr:uncharacterized protein LOC107360040 [Tetranychus urticae]